MSFDARSLERLRELGRQLPQKLEDPHPASGNGPETSRQANRQNRPGQNRPDQSSQAPKRHRVETEQDPEALFRELMSVSEDGTVPEHLMARLTETVYNFSGHTKCLGRDQAHLQAVKQ